MALVKGAWSKFVTFDELMIELLFAKLLSDAPELVAQFGPALDVGAARAPAPARHLGPGARPADGEHAQGGLPRGARRRRRPQPHAHRLRAVLRRPRHDAAAQWEKVRDAFLWAFRKIPHLDEMEREDLGRRRRRRARPFFDEAILEPMSAYAEYEAEALSGRVVAEMEASAERMLARAQEAGTFFYERVFSEHPAALQFFRTSDLDTQAHHLIAAVAFLARAARQPEALRPELRNLAAVHVNHQIPTSAYPLVAAPLMADDRGLRRAAVRRPARRGWEVLLDRVVRIICEPMHVQERLVAAAQEFLDQIAEELHWPQRKQDKRWSEVLVRDPRRPAPTPRPSRSSSTAPASPGATPRSASAASPGATSSCATSATSPSRRRSSTNASSTCAPRATAATSTSS